MNQQTTQAGQAGTTPLGAVLDAEFNEVPPAGTQTQETTTVHKTSSSSAPAARPASGFISLFFSFVLGIFARIASAIMWVFKGRTVVSVTTRAAIIAIPLTVVFLMVRGFTSSFATSERLHWFSWSATTTEYKTVGHGGISADEAYKKVGEDPWVPIPTK
jgi:hypothetical protein